MARLTFLYLPICNNKNVPKSKEKFPKKVLHFAKYKESLKQLPKIFKMLKLWRNFAKSGHTGT